MSKELKTLEGDKITQGEAKAPLAQLNDRLLSERAKFEKVLPAHIPFEKFQSVVMTAVITQPDLLKADRPSFILACIKSATDGLLPDNRDAALVIFNRKVKIEGQPDQWIKLVQYLPMYSGIMKKVRQSGEVSSISTQIVYEKDIFEHRLGDEEKIIHTRSEEAERGEVRAAYCIVTLKDGTIQREVMYRADIEKVRKTSKSGDENGKPKGIWATWYEEMSRKTVFRRAAKWLPQSIDRTDVRRLIEQSDKIEMLDSITPDAPLEFDPTTGEVNQIEDQSGDKKAEEPQPDLKDKIEEKKSGGKKKKAVEAEADREAVMADVTKILGAVKWEVSDYPPDNGMLIFTDADGATLKLTEAEAMERAQKEKTRLDKASGEQKAMDV